MTIHSRCVLAEILAVKTLEQLLNLFKCQRVLIDNCFTLDYCEIVGRLREKELGYGVIEFGYTYQRVAEAVWVFSRGIG